jgi:hypothetical protein
MIINEEVDGILRINAEIALASLVYDENSQALNGLKSKVLPKLGQYAGSTVFYVAAMEKHLVTARTMAAIIPSNPEYLKLIIKNAKEKLGFGILGNPMIDIYISKNL